MESIISQRLKIKMIRILTFLLFTFGCVLLLVWDTNGDGRAVDTWMGSWNIIVTGANAEFHAIDPALQRFAPIDYGYETYSVCFSAPLWRLEFLGITTQERSVGYATVYTTFQHGPPTLTAQCYELWLPLPYVIAGIFMPLFWSAWGRFGFRRRRQEGMCLVCGYDLRTSTLRCPECGTPLAAAHAIRENVPHFEVVGRSTLWLLSALLLAQGIAYGAMIDVFPNHAGILLRPFAVAVSLAFAPASLVALCSFGKASRLTAGLGVVPAVFLLAFAIDFAVVQWPSYSWDWHYGSLRLGFDILTGACALVAVSLFLTALRK
jgi:hypothetical protein